MRKLIKLYSFALYILSFLIFTVLGLFIAKWTGAGKGQMLAAGAIVLFNGLLVGIVGIVVAIIIARYGSRKLVIGLNILFVLLLLAFYVFARIYYKKEHEDDPPPMDPKEMIPTAPAPDTAPINNEQEPVLMKEEASMGMGFFSPNFYEHPTLYFYGQPNFEKSVVEHMPYDSLVFKNTELGWESVYGPPWLAPEYANLDFGIFRFKVNSIGRDIIEVEGNHFNGQRAYVDRFAGKLVLWPEFILSVNTVEFIEGRAQAIKSKPLENAGELHADFVQMRPLQVKSNWLQVILKDNDRRTIDLGWIKWREGEELLVRYNVFD